MTLKLMQGDKEVYMMTFKEAATLLNTTTKELRALAKKSLIPYYDYAGGRICSGDLDIIKEQLN